MSQNNIGACEGCEAEDVRLEEVTMVYGGTELLCEHCVSES